MTYPSVIPVDEIKTLFAIITGKQDRNLKLAAHSGWIVQGYLQGLIIGDPSVTSSVSAMHVNTYTNIDDSQAAALLGTLATLEAYLPDDVMAAGIGDLFGGIVKRRLAGMILPILQKWLTSLLEDGGLERLIENIIGGIGSRGVDMAKVACCD